MKTSDLFVGITDFFANLVPGAIAAFMVANQGHFAPPQNWPAIQFGTVEGWTVFLVSAYVLGHLISAIAGLLLDGLYDRTYVPWKQASFSYVKQQLVPKATFLLVVTRRLRHVLKKTSPQHALFLAAECTKKEELKGMARSAGVEPLAITNLYWWAGSVIRAQGSAGTEEVEVTAAQSKLFRSLVLLLPAAVVWVGSYDLWSIGLWLLVLVFALQRYMKLRWDAVQRTYEYYVISQGITSKGADGSAGT